ncbi:HypC/HybG/HupF family hydrogenase formation chaperone [Candidatus Woesearchaeota archaeon]|nr:HypC/HybG/HupF family hydrogenase formation chaperone [Candidatus Woesearchaeota archaeon]
MCLSIPGKITAIDGHRATIDYGGEVREAGTALLPDVRVGDYVIVSAKMIMQKVPAAEAKKTLQVWDETND